MWRKFGMCLATVWLLGASSLFAQCGCNDEGCGSNCQCGCNSPETSAPPRGGAGGEGGQGFESQNVVLLKQFSLSDMGVTDPDVRGNDCWGWTHSSGREFAIFGLTNATTFFDITNPKQARFLGTLPTAHGNATWRDIKVYNNRAYIVADGSANSNHGVQVFNLERLLDVRRDPQVFTADARYTGLGRAHNIAINEETGFAYVIGSPSLSSSGGPIILDLKQGILPVLAGVFNQDGYTHDTHVVKYRGPVRRHQGKEIAFCSNEDTLTIVDVTNKSNLILLSRTGYNQAAFSHQGWLSENHDFFFMNDELDEQQIATTRTRTHVWSLESLEQPLYVGFIQGTNRTIDHNLYVKGNYIFEANYSSGLRILDARRASNLKFTEVGFFDTYAADNAVSFNGAWSCYPYFPSGNMIVSDRQNGLFILRFSPP